MISLDFDIIKSPNGYEYATTVIEIPINKGIVQLCKSLKHIQNQNIQV